MVKLRKSCYHKQKYRRCLTEPKTSYSEWSWPSYFSYPTADFEQIHGTIKPPQTAKYFFPLYSVVHGSYCRDN